MYVVMFGKCIFVVLNYNTMIGGPVGSVVSS